MRVWGWLEPRLEALFRRVDAALDRAQRWLDATADRPLRAWVRPLLLALATTAVVGLLLRLVLAALTRGGAVGRWVGAVVAAGLALVLLVLIVRNVVVSLVEPSQRRYLLIAVLTSGAALIVAVEAFTALTVASAGEARSMWTVERFYLRELVGAIPLLDVPERLQWTEGPVLSGLPGRVLALTFAVVAIPPLARVGVALYGFVETHNQDRRYRDAISRRVSRLIGGGYALYGPSFLVVAAGAGAAVSVVAAGDLPKPVWSLGGLAFVLTVAAVALAALVVAGGFDTWLTDKPWLFSLVPAVVLVWFDSPVRRALVPSAADLGIVGRAGVTLLIWLILFAVVGLLLWTEPEFPEAVWALVLVVGLLGADAPAVRWLHEHLTWRPGGFAVDRAVAAAGGWFAVAFLVRMLWRIPQRAPVLGRGGYADDTSDLRADLRGYVLVGAQIVIAAGAALTLLRQFGAARVTGTPGGRWSDASQALTAATWQVVHSIPGPDVTEILDWRLTTRFTGRWAGLVIVVAIAAIVVFAALPLIRTVLVWGRLTAAGRPRSTQALTAVPSKVAEDLQAAVDFFQSAIDEGVGWETIRRQRPGPRWLSERVVLRRPGIAAEHRLTEATLDLPKLASLFGASHPWVDAADEALTRATEAYQAYLKAMASQVHIASAATKLRGIEREVAAARAAVDAYREAIRRWEAALSQSA